MTPDAWLVAAVLVLLFAALVRGVAPAPVLMVGALVVLVVLGVASPPRALVGFVSPATLTIGGLFVVARTVREHLGLERVLSRLLEADGDRVRPTLLRLLPTVATLSGVVNNTPVVATTAPVVRDWARRHGVDHQRLLIPLSFATILGGTLTTIGTSTNLVVSGSLEAAGHEPLGFFTVTAVGLPLAVVGLGLLVLLAPRLLPVRRTAPQPVGGRPRRSGSGSVALGSPALGSPAPGRVDEPAADGGVPDDPVGGAPVRGDREGTPPSPAGSRRRRILTVTAVLGMVGAAASGLVPMVTAVLVAGLVLLATGTIGLRSALDAVDLGVLVIVGAAIGLGLAVEESGLAAVVGEHVATLASHRGALLGVAVVVLGTLLMTELITNVAAAALMVPVAVDVATRVGGDPRGFAVAVAVTASASFLTPIGYQTNTIVYRLGGHRFGDYWRLGLPLGAAAVVVAVLVVPLVW